MNALVPLKASALPAVFQNMSNVPDMNSAAQQGLSGGFGVVSYKGKNWRIKYAGDDEVIMDPRGVPDPLLEAVIVGVAGTISKQWYSATYSEGDDAAPDCFSVNGVTPDPASPHRQCESCAVCPKNQWGTKVTTDGTDSKAKACQDSRRIAVVPLGDILNEDYGGPMLLRIPPTSLRNLATYTKELSRYGAQPFMVHTRIGFDHNVAYPLLQFQAVRWLTQDEGVQVATVLEDEQIKRILEEAAVEAPTQAAPSALAGGAPPAALTNTAPAPVSVNQPAPTPAPAPVQQAAPQPAKKRGGFGGAAAAPVAQQQPAPVQQPVQQVEQTAPLQQPVTTLEADASQPEKVTAIQAAPSDMESAIDDLLNG